MRKASSLSASRLLGALPPDTRARFVPELETVHPGFKDVLYGEDAPISHVYFPVDSVISLLTVMENGDAVEVGTVGTEGFVGIPVLLGTRRSPTPALALSQIPGTALRIGVDAFQEALGREPALHALLLQYANAFFLQVAQSAACNRLHPIDQRCCRWLLMTQDRVGSNDIPLTQEFLGQMLGVRRASVNAVAGLLQQERLIRYNRGRIAILDRKRLEEASCECYHVIRTEFDRLLGAPLD